MNPFTSLPTNANHSLRRSLKQSGFSLIELITAMLASTALIVALAATLAISTQLMEVPPSDEAIWQDRQIVDRIAADLRYATSVSETSDGFVVTNPDPESGLLRGITYRSDKGGLSRQVDGQTAITLDPAAASQQFSVDGYSAPTNASADHYVRVRSSRTAVTESLASTLEVAVPPGCKPGDLIICCISAKSLSGFGISGTGWNALQISSISNLRLIVGYRTYDDSWAPTVTVSMNPAAAVAVALVAIERVNTVSPVAWSTTSRGYSVNTSSITHPLAIESSGISSRQLNLQIFAAELDPWDDAALGVPGFTDVVQVTALLGDSNYRNTLGIVVRNGATPAMSASPRPLHQTSGYWIHVGASLELSP